MNYLLIKIVFICLFYQTDCQANDPLGINHLYKGIISHNHC